MRNEVQRKGKVKEHLNFILQKSLMGDLRSDRQASHYYRNIDILYHFIWRPVSATSPCIWMGHILFDMSIPSIPQYVFIYYVYPAFNVVSRKLTKRFKSDTLKRWSWSESGLTHLKHLSSFLMTISFPCFLFNFISKKCTIHFNWS